MEKRTIRIGRLWSLALGLSVFVAFIECGSSTHLSSTTGGPLRESEDRDLHSRGQYTDFAVAADNAEASMAGAEVLARGGNAADAAAATMLALGVTHPASSGLGGGGFALYYRAEDQSLHYLDFREEAPAASTVDMFAARPSEDDDTASMRSRVGGLAVGVPGEPAGIAALIERFGSGQVNRGHIAAPAIRLAREGFVATAPVARYSRRLADSLRQDPLFARWLTEHASGMVEGERYTNPALADTLERFVAEGVRTFYEGAVAEAIVEAVRAHGGIMTMDDLAAYEVRERDPLEGHALGYRWVSSPPPSAGGFTMLSSLRLLNQWLPQNARTEDGPAFRHALAESWKGPFGDRRQFMGDPDHVDIPLTALMDDSRNQARARAFDQEQAQTASAYEQPLPNHSPHAATPGGDHGTSHLCVVDREGNVASITTTINLPFGAQFSAAGIVMNDEMDDFAREVGRANAFGLVGGAPNLPGPGRRPVSSMSPTIVFDEANRPILCAGASGGSRIITATEQVALFVLLFGDTPAEAIARPRIHHQGVPVALSFEQGLNETWQQALRTRGHELTAVEHSAVVQAIQIIHGNDGRRLAAASDARKGGQPAGR